jgi:hypothetical protein
MCSISSAGSSSGGSTNSPSHQAHLHKQARNSQVLYPLASRAPCVPSVGGIHQLPLPPGSPAQAGQEQPGTVPTSYQSSMCSISWRGFTNSPSHQAHQHKETRNSQVLYPLATRAPCVPSVGGIHQLALQPGSPAQASQEQPGTVPTSYHISVCSISSAIR